MSAKLKLSKKQREVVLAMRAGATLVYTFYTKKTVISIGGNMITQSVAAVLSIAGLIYLKRMDTSGLTKHYYELTEKGKTIDL